MTLLPLHIVAGGLGLLSGYAALSVTKGAPLHRKIGMLFVCAMLTMSVTGLLISALGGIAPAINIPIALLTFYLVITSLTTVRPRASWSRPTEIAAMLLGFAVGVGCLVLAVSAIGKGGAEAGMAYPLVMFGAVALSASAGDLRVIRAGGVRGAPRLARHLWRMCFALFIASIAFFLGQGRVPAAIRTPALIAAGALLPIVAMAYWLWRVRGRRSGRGIVRVSAPEAAPL